MADELSTADIAAERDSSADAPLARDSGDEDRRPLLDQPETESFTTRWREIQVDFVDRPRESVEQDAVGGHRQVFQVGRRGAGGLRCGAIPLGVILVDQRRWLVITGVAR